MTVEKFLSNCNECGGTDGVLTFKVGSIMVGLCSSCRAKMIVELLKADIRPIIQVVPNTTKQV